MPDPSDLTVRLTSLEEQGAALQAEGLPFPTEQIRAAFEEANRSGAPEQAAAVVKRGEALLQRVRRDWGWVRELLRRVDELRQIAQDLGVDLAHLDARVGNPRAQLAAAPLSAGTLEKTAASASIALAVLNDAIPKFCVQEAQQLGTSIRRARNRGEEMTLAAQSFSRLIQALQDENLPSAAERLVETRKLVARIPRAPSIAAISPKEEEEILLEARNLARRLQRIKTSARDAASAARLMTQVRAALAEDRRFGTPEEEIEALWQEVDRLTQQKRQAGPPPPVESPAAPEPPAPAGAETLPDALPTPATPPTPEPEEELPPERSSPPFSFYVPYVPPDPVDVTPRDDEDGPAASSRRRPKPRT
ncbi:MAG TPA: hypothetical protein VMG36_07490 [Thermoplasmata archaeon]|nr:hypothetical protein [Thermoplasmata archaeon]